MYATYRQKAAAKSIEDGIVFTACINAFMWDLRNIKKRSSKRSWVFTK